MNELKWSYVEAFYFNFHKEMLNEVTEDHQLFQLTYRENIAWYHENEAFNLVLPATD